MAEDVAARWPVLLRDNFVLRAPAYIDCTGPSFPDEWDEYHREVVAWDTGLLESGAYHANTGTMVWLSEEVLESSERVGGLTHTLLERYMPGVVAAGGAGLDRVLRERDPVSALGGTCYYGLVQCLWVRAFLLQHRGRVDEAMLELSTAMAILGQDFRGDYIDSSRWPVRGLEIHLSLEQRRLTRWPRFSQVVNMPAYVSAAEVPLRSRRAADSSEPGRRFITGGREHHFSIAALGNHAALLSEPVGMVRGAFPELRIAVHWYLSGCRWRDPMHHYHCRLNCMLLGDCIFQDMPWSPSRRLLQLVDFAAEGVGDEALAEDASMGGLLDAAWRLWNAEESLRDSSLIVCTLPLVCSLLRAVSQTPMLGYFAMWAFLNPAVKGTGEWAMMHFAEMAKNTWQNAFAFSNGLLSDLAAAQLGVKLPVVRPFGLYAQLGHARYPRPFAVFDGNVGRYHNNIVVPRSYLTMETSFLHALRAFTEAVQPGFPLNFTVLMSASSKTTSDVNLAYSPPPGGDSLRNALRHDHNVFVDSNDFILFRAAVFLPQAPNMMSFYEFHSMHLPMFIPGWDWLYRMYQQIRWRKLSERFRDAAEERPMRPPLCDHYILTNRLGNNSLASWVLLYERHFEAKLPGVRPVGSFPELLEGLLFTDFAKLREEMRQHNERTFEPVIQWYRASVLGLLTDT